MNNFFHLKLPKFGNFYLSLQHISPLMNVIFLDDALKELYETGKTKDSKYKKLCRDRRFIEAYIDVVALFESVESTSSLKAFSSLHYEHLRYRPESSVRIMNRRIERLIFTEHDEGIEVKLIEIDSTHYGNKH